MIEKLKRCYDGKSIQEIESVAMAALRESESNRRQFIEALYFLRHTKRFRENTGYKNATFDCYLRGRFMMTEAGFDKERIAYICFPEAAERYGPGIVGRVVSKVGTIRAGRVFKGLSKLATVEKIDREILKHAPAKKESGSSEPTKNDLFAEIATLKAAVRERDRLIAQQQSQIEKLKVAVVKYKKTSCLCPPSDFDAPIHANL